MYEDPTALRWCVASMGIIGLLLAVASGCWLCERRLPQRMFAKFKSLSPLAKVVSVVALALSTWFGGAKPGGGGSGDPEDPPSPMMSGCHGGTVLLSPGGRIPIRWLT